MHSRRAKTTTCAVWVLTPKAVMVATRLIKKMGMDALFAGPSIVDKPDGAVSFKSLSEAVTREFGRFSSHIFIMAAGIVIRTIAPLLKSKLSDPAVVVVDDHGKFAVSLISGHLGGANELALRVAECINAVPVITTATDIAQVPAIDLLAKRKGCVIENPETIKTVNMALLKGQKVWLHDPVNFLKKDLEGWFTNGLGQERNSIPGVYVDYKKNWIQSKVLVLRPKILSVGVGCNRNTPVREILDHLQHVFEKFGFSMDSISNIATIDAKADEQGVVELANELKVPARFFSPDELRQVKEVPSPSEMVKKHMGVGSVCEAAAILASNQGELVIPKQLTRNVTLAVAVKPSTFLE